MLPWSSPLFRWTAPLVSGSALAATGVLLITDLKHPERFYLIFTRPQWRSWLVRGAFIIGAYSAVLAAHVLASLAGATKLQRFLAVADKKQEVFDEDLIAILHDENEYGTGAAASTADAAKAITGPISFGSPARFRWTGCPKSRVM